MFAGPCRMHSHTKQADNAGTLYIRLGGSAARLQCAFGPEMALITPTASTLLIIHSRAPHARTFRSQLACTSMQEHQESCGRPTCVYRRLRAGIGADCRRATCPRARPLINHFAGRHRNTKHQWLTLKRFLQCRQKQARQSKPLRGQESKCFPSLTTARSRLKRRS